MDILAYRKKLKNAFAEANTSMIEIMRELESDINHQVAIYNDIILLIKRINSFNRENSSNTSLKENLLAMEAKLTQDCLAIIDRVNKDDLILDDSEFDAKGLMNVEPMNKKVFISTPIASLSNENDYQALKAVADDIQNALFDKTDFDAYYAGNTISSFEDFHTPTASIKKDFQAIHMSEYFLLIVPSKIMSSIWVEAGYAMALEKKCLFFVKDIADLPFLLREADKVFKNVKTLIFKEFSDIPKMLLAPGTMDF